MKSKRLSIVICLCLLSILFGGGHNDVCAQSYNKVLNPGFEVDQAATQTPTNWLTLSTNDADADKTEYGWTHSGDYKLTHWKATPFEIYTYQTIQGLSNGTYNFEFWYANGGDQVNCYVEIKDFGGTPIQMPIPVSSGWTSLQINDINITTGNATIGVYSNAQGGYWINMDDFLLYNQAEPTPTPTPTATNFLSNPGFEQGTGNVPTNWTITGSDPDASYMEGWAHSGASKLTNWKGSAYQVYTYQTMTGLANDTYALEFWYTNGGQQADCYLEIKDHGGDPIKVPLSTSSKWFKVKIPNIQVTTGTCTIGLNTDAQANYWINLDDLVFSPDTPYPAPDTVTFTTPRTPLKIRGVDISTLPLVEAMGGKYYDDAGDEQDLFTILNEHGVNYVRLRIWNNPANGYCNLDKTLAMATRIKNAGMKFLLDFHYSDSWADPGKQNKPAAWSSLSFAELQTAVYTYTNEVITALKNQGTLPDMVQIGNEITNGMLWPDGRNLDSAGWSQFAQLVKSGVKGVKDALNAGDYVKIMIHIDKGGDNAASVQFYDALLAQGVKFDVIGLSYYIFWHGRLPAFYNNLIDLATRYGKGIVVVELAFPFTLNDGDGDTQIIHSEDQIRSFGYPATIAGQQQYLEEVLEIIRHTPNGKGLGFFYWEPAWLPLPGAGWDPTDPTSKNGWENQGVFNFDGYALDGLEAFIEPPPPIPPDPTATPGGGSAVPEPATFGLLGVGVALLLGLARMRR